MFDKIVANYFVLNGRLNRKPYVMVSFVYIPIASIIISGIFYLFFSKIIYFLFLTIWSLIVAAVSFSITFRRLHDLGHSKFTYLWFLVPVINFYWAYKTIFVRGTYGDNEYGADPLLSLGKY